MHDLDLELTIHGVRVSVMTYIGLAEIKLKISSSLFDDRLFSALVLVVPDDSEGCDNVPWMIGTSIISAHYFRNHHSDVHILHLITKHALLVY